MGDGHSETTTVGETERVDGGMRLTVDEISLMSGAPHGATVLLPPRGWIGVVDDGVSRSASESSLRSSLVDSAIGIASRCWKIRGGSTKASDVSPDSLACIGGVGSSDRRGCAAAIPATDGADRQGSCKATLGTGKRHGSQVLLSATEGPVMGVAWVTRTELVPRSEGVNLLVELG
jgi:hypothetical protein